MNLEAFLSILTSFSISDPVRKKDHFLIELPNGDLLESNILLDSTGNVEKIIDSNNNEMLPLIWICEKLGRLSSLAKSIHNALFTNDPFISPIGNFEINWSLTEETAKENDSVCERLKIICEKDNFWESHVIYLTSNAGEGKTTILERLSCHFADKYRPGKGKLIVPISLSGKPFIRFEDIVIATLANKYKFSGYFYPSFLALVKLGFIVPAFDGFEEMFVESPSGEAISAMAELIKDINGKGLILVAARSAYFEHQNLSTQGKLYNSINTTPVVFSKVRIDRWNKEQFINYGIERAHTKQEALSLYDKILPNYGVEHPILTRAVLVKKLYEAFEEDSNIDAFSTIDPQDYNAFFSNFVYALIEREAKKWLMKSKQASTPVLSVKQHYGLLSMIAKEMWITRSEILRADVLETITDLFIEAEALNADAAWQVKQRVRDHAVLRISDKIRSHFEFDHQDFYQFFLGNALSLAIKTGEIEDFVDICRRGRLPKTSLMCTAYEIKISGNAVEISKKLMAKIHDEQKSSYARENLAICIILLNQSIRNELLISQVSFESEPFDSIELNDIVFNECIFSAVKLNNIKEKIVFDNCKIHEMEYQRSVKVPAIIKGETEIDSLFYENEERNEYAPAAIKNELSKVLEFEKHKEKDISTFNTPFEVDERLIIIEKVLRVFYNRIEVNKDTLKQRLGVKFSGFWNEILPDLKELVFEDAPYRGGGAQERIRIVCKLEHLQKALEMANGQYENFLTFLRKKAERKYGYS